MVSKVPLKIPPRTQSVATNLEDVDFDEWSHKLKFQGFIDWQKQAKARPLACSFKTMPLSGFSKTVTQIYSLPQTPWLLRNLCDVLRPCPVETRPIPAHVMLH